MALGFDESAYMGFGKWWSMCEVGGCTKCNHYGSNGVRNMSYKETPSTEIGTINCYWRMVVTFKCSFFTRKKNAKLLYQG